MMKQSGRFKASKQVVTLLCLTFFIILIICFRQNPALVERFYSDGFYRVICHVFRPAVNWLSFSFGDIIYTIVILLLLFGAFRLFRFLFIKRFHLAGKLAVRFIIGLEIAWLWFYCFWGLNYYRPPAAILLKLDDTTYTLNDVAKVTTLIIDSANMLRAALKPVDFQQNNEMIYQNSRAAVLNLASGPAKFDIISPRVKPSIFSHLLNYMGTSGYYNPFTTEAQLNYLMPIVDKPFVACHEMGHQTGWAREDEANFAGYIAGVNSSDKLLRYSAYYAGIEEFMRYLRRRDTAVHHTLRLRISPLVFQDFKTDSIYWTKYEGRAEVVSGIFFDKFLKANNQPHGLKTYNRMILLTMAYYRKRYAVW